MKMAPNLNVDTPQPEESHYGIHQPSSGIILQNIDNQDTRYTGFWGPPTSTNDFCEQNYEVVPFIAEFWSTITNVVMIFTGLWGIYTTQKQGFEKRYQIVYLGLLTVGVGSWMFHMTLKYEMQLLDELPMVWGGCVALYEMHQIQRSKKEGHDKLFGLFLFLSFGIGFPIVYLRWRYPVILFVSYGSLIANIAWMDLKLIFSQRNRDGTRVYFIGLTMQLIGVILWTIDNLYCSKLQVLRTTLYAPLVPFTQLHGWWHIFAGYSSYLHIIFCLHHRQIFLKEKSTLTFQPWIGITIEKVIANQISPLGKLSAQTKTYAANDDAKNK